MNKLMVRLCVLSFVLLFACKNGEDSTPDDSDKNTHTIAPPTELSYEIVKVYPHDTTSFTQGLFFHNNEMYESTGSNNSRMLKVDIETGKIKKERAIPKEYFGEGSVILGDKLYQLTWQNHKVFVYDVHNWDKVSELSWGYEGWGITTDSTHLIISTGSSELYFVKPENLQVVKTLSVSNNYGLQSMLNELEYVDGFIYANQFLTNSILKIDAKTGHIVGTLNMDALLTASAGPLNGTEVSSENVLNGIAYNPVSKTFFVTGKRWSKMFEIKINP